jgi:TonB family protein
MKSSVCAATLAIALAGQVSPASALTTATPSITLVPLSAPHVAVVEGRPGCDAPAAVDGNPFFEMPTIAADMGISGTSQVKIDLTSDGKLAAAQLFESSGNRWLDQAALRSAKMTRYTSETVSCEHVAGSYLYEVQF